jgi:tetratricopeptide (TPR) repeat protein
LPSTRAITLTRHYLASVYSSSGRAKLAIEQYETLLKLNPADYRALNSMALVLEQTGDDRAIDYASSALKLRPNDPAVLDTWVGCS